MKVAFELSPEQAGKLRSLSARLGVAPEKLAQAAVADLLSNPDEAFEAAADRVLRKNDELYRRRA